MPLTITKTSKARITVTLNQDLIHQFDQLVKDWENVSRSQVIEGALRDWLKEQARREIEIETEAYYRSLSLAEKKEDRQWAKLNARAAKHLWNR